MWTTEARIVGNRTGQVESSKNEVEDRPANVGEWRSSVDVAACRASAQFHNM